MTPSGTLVVVLRDGPARVPFQPKVARIFRANEQLAAILGRSVSIEIDGSLLPQDHDGAQDVVARLVEDLTRDMAALRDEDKEAFALARASFERLVVRYAPTEAAERRREVARFDVPARTVDVTLGEARWRPLDEHVIGRVILAHHEATLRAKYERTPPEQLPESEQRAWATWHLRGRSTSTKTDPYANIAGFDGFRVRGMVTLHALATRRGDAELAKTTRGFLVSTIDTLGRAYWNERRLVTNAPAGSSFREAEAAYLGWLRAELPRFTRDEKGELAEWLFFVEGERDASWVYPGIDRSAFVIGAVDSWVAEGKPPVPPAHTSAKLYEHTFCPRVEETPSSAGRASTRPNGKPRMTDAGRCSGRFYRWALAREDGEKLLADLVLTRRDPALTGAVAHGAKNASSNGNAGKYHRWLRRLEGDPASWRLAIEEVDDGYPDEPLLEEMRRVWRTSPPLRPTALRIFGGHAKRLYPEQEAQAFADFLQGTRVSAKLFADYLDEGELPAFDAVPAIWPALEKGGRVTALAKATRAHLDRGRHGNGRYPGQPGVVGVLAQVGGLLCAEGASAEVAELRAFAEGELTARPGAGFTDVLEATKPEECARRAAEHGRGPRGANRAKPPAAKPKPPDPTLFPPKPPLRSNELPGGGF